MMCCPAFTFDRTDALNSSCDADFTLDGNARKGCAPKCPRCGSFVGMLQSLPPHIVEIDTGPTAKELPDLILGSGDEILLSDRLLASCLTAGLGGLDDRALPISISVKGELKQISCSINDFWIVRPPRSQTGFWRPNTTKRICEFCGDRGYRAPSSGRICHEPPNCPNEDVFYEVGLPGQVLFSENFRSFVLSGGFTGFFFRD